jgi:2-oxo-3-hexenedioate decarboxylase/2-keto-4-pentenoate hydratase
MKDLERAQAAAALHEAEQTSAPIEPVTHTYSALTVDDAYEIQLINVRRRVSSGSVVKGHKVGLTARAMQEMLGVNEPDYGHLLDDMFQVDGASVRIERFLQPRVEVEIAFRLRTPLAGPDVSVDDVLAATESVAPSIEIIDSRIADWKITLADTIADNASSAGVIIGPWHAVDEMPALETIAADLVKNGQVVASGKGADVLGHPATAVAWLANRLSALGVQLEAGHVVMPGSCTKAVDVTAGDQVRADFGELGTASVRFV